MSEETQVGSIVGKLKLDSSDWNAELATAEERAHQLGRANPTIKVETTGTAEAVSELAAVEAAEKKVGAEEVKASASSQALARMRAQGRAITLAQAQSEVEAQKPLIDFTKYTQIHTEATKQSLFERLRLTAAEAQANVEAKKSSAEAKKAIADSKAKASMMGMLVAGIGAVAPALVPIAAYATAGAGALAMLGVTGILAIKGISDEIKNGGPLADQFSNGLNTLKEDFNALARTSAVGMLDGFNRSIATIDAYMPGLTQQTSDYSRVLGNLGANSLSGLLGAFRTLDPIFRVFAGYLGDLTQRLSSIGSSKGLQSFGDYALSVMPRVESMLESLVTGVGNLLVSLAPLGSVGITILKGLGDMLTAIPHDVLTMLVSGALAAYGAFSAWTNLIPIIQSFGIMLNTSLGPIGLVVAGVGALIGVMIGATASTNDATAATMSYTAALEKDNGVIGDNVKAHVAEELAKSSAVQATNKLGLSTELMMKAVLGDVDAKKRLGVEMQVLIDKSQRLGDRVSKTSGSMGDWMTQNQELKKNIAGVNDVVNNQSGALKSTVEQYNAYEAAMGKANASASAQSSEVQGLANRYGTTVATMQGLLDGQQQTADQLEKTTLQMQLQNDAGGLLKNQLDLLSGKSLSFEQAQNGFEKQLHTATSALTTAKAAVDAHGNSLAANAVVLEGNSEAAVNNRGSLLGLVTSAEQSAEAYGNMTGKSADAKSKLEELRQKIIDNAAANGMNRDAVEKYVDSVMKVPELKPTKIELDAAAATQKAEYLKWLIDNTNSKSIELHAETSVSGPDVGQRQVEVGQVGKFERGGIVNYLATGGLPLFKPQGTDTVPAMLTPKEFVVRKHSAESVGYGALDYINRTGQLPPQQGGMPAVNVAVTVQNPFTGEEVVAVVKSVAVIAASAAIKAADQDASRRASR